MMQITKSEYNEYMSLLESAIYDYRNRYKKLQATIDNWNDFFNPTSKNCGLTIEEMKDLQKSFKERQHKLFLQWYDMNKRLREQGLDHYAPEKERTLGSYLIELIRWTDLLETA